MKRLFTLLALVLFTSQLALADSISNTNTEVVGEAPAIGMGEVYLEESQNVTPLWQDSQLEQNLNSILGQYQLATTVLTPEVLALFKLYNES